jgi:hypothetical protein
MSPFYVDRAETCSCKLEVSEYTERNIDRIGMEAHDMMANFITEPHKFKPGKKVDTISCGGKARQVRHIFHGLV